MRKIATLSSTVYGESKNKRDKELTRQGESKGDFNGSVQYLLVALLPLEVSEDQHKGEKRPGMSGGHVEGNPINFKELIQSGSQNTEQMHLYQRTATGYPSHFGPAAFAGRSRNLQRGSSIAQFGLVI